MAGSTFDLGTIVLTFAILLVEIENKTFDGLCLFSSWAHADCNSIRNWRLKVQYIGGGSKRETGQHTETHKIN